MQVRAFLNWLATSPFASFLKLFVAGGLGWVISNLDSLNVHPVVAAALAASLPWLVNYFNAEDDRFGVVQEQGDETE